MNLLYAWIVQALHHVPHRTRNFYNHAAHLNTCTIRTVYHAYRITRMLYLGDQHVKIEIEIKL
jgi:hypothetical protein